MRRPSSDQLIAGRTVVETYYDISRNRYEGVLVGDFPQMRPHFKRFRGRHDSPYERSELEAMFAGLDPSGVEALEALNEAGVLRPADNRDVAVASRFEIARVYRAGLGLSIHARP